MLKHGYLAKTNRSFLHFYFSKPEIKSLYSREGNLTEIAFDLCARGGGGNGLVLKLKRNNFYYLICLWQSWNQICPYLGANISYKIKFQIFFLAIVLCSKRKTFAKYHFFNFLRSLQCCEHLKLSEACDARACSQTYRFFWNWTEKNKTDRQHVSNFENRQKR